jgi:AraC family ethanolamine operon transcriptional activator
MIAWMTARGRIRTRSRVDRSGVLVRIEEFLAKKVSEPIYVADLCNATGLPERTLRHVVVEIYGVAPMRLLRVRRLRQLRDALAGLPDQREKIGALAATFGFRHMGQLAIDYRNLHGESPSETLRRARLLGARCIPTGSHPGAAQEAPLEDRPMGPPSLPLAPFA